MAICLLLQFCAYDLKRKLIHIIYLRSAIVSIALVPIIVVSLFKTGFRAQGGNVITYNHCNHAIDSSSIALVPSHIQEIGVHLNNYN